MKEHINYKIISAFFLALIFALPTVGLAKKKKKYETKILSLSVGLSHDEQILRAPKNFKKTGNYRKHLKLQFNAKEKTLRIIPKKEGVGTLTIQNPYTGRILYEYQYDVKESKLNKFAREIQDLLSDIDGITIKIVNNRVVVDGKVLLPKDIGRIHNVIQQYGDSAVNLVSLSSKAQVKIAQYMERAINNPEIHVRALNNKFLLEGVANNEAEKVKAEALARAYMPDEVSEDYTAQQKVKTRDSVIVNLISIRPAPAQGPGKIIQVVLHYVELKKDYNKGFRVQWTPDLGDGSALRFSTGGQGQSGLISTITGTISNLLPKLNWAKEHGHARVLQSASIITQDGKKGILNSQTDIPYTSSSADGRPITSFAPVGLIANVTPSVMGARSDSISIDAEFSLSSLTGASSDGRPQISRNKVTTSVVIRSGQSAAIGGLINNSSGTDYNRLPANVSRNPIISIYASKSFRRSQSQFVVFMTPVIKSSASQGADRIKKRFRIK